MNQIHREWQANLTISAMVLCGAVAFSPSTRGDAEKTLAPGSDEVVGLRLQPFLATWSQRLAGDEGWTERGGVQEELTIVREGDRELLLRTQTTLGRLTFVNRTLVDRSTLAPVRFERELVSEVSPELQQRLDQAGVLRSYKIEFDGATYTKVSTSADGTEAREQHTLGMVPFEGSILGLTVAALPLEAGYSARLPIAFIAPQDGSVSEYLVEASVQGTDQVAIGGGRTTEAWLVDVSWIDPETGEVSSAGGADEAGGAYWILSQPEGGIPHVPKYRNESVDFELK